VPNTDDGRAQRLLSELVGSDVSSAECDEHQLRLIFGRSEFVTHSPWRIVIRGELLVGSGDIQGRDSEAVLKHVKGRNVVSVLVSDCWDTQLLFENGCVLEIMSDSVMYETWEAHLAAGWVVLAGGGVTLFPPSASQEADSPSRTRD
jgi:hypothetical protein